MLFKRENNIGEEKIITRVHNKNEERPIAKFESPQILMIDCPKYLVEKVQKDGFNVETGTFGIKYRLSNNGKNKYLAINDEIEDIIEKDIIIINMKKDEYSDEIYQGLTGNIPSGSYWWADWHEIEFNPRNLGSYKHQQSFKKLKYKNSVIILFSKEENTIEYVNKTIKDGTIQQTWKPRISNYEFLPYDINVQQNQFTKKYKDVSTGILKNIFKNYKKTIESYCTFYRSPFKKNFYQPILKNIYGETIAYCEYDKDDENQIINTLIVLPQCEDMYLPISNILNDVLPNAYPEMMADLVKDNWTHDEKYIFPKAKQLIAEKNAIQNEYEQKLSEIDNLLSEEYEKYKFMYDILSSTGTGEKLVEAIIKCLEYIGYKKVINYDKENPNEYNEEDLHIYYGDKDEEYFIAEVKGVNGPAIEDDCNVITKYKSRNCEKLNKSFIHGIVFFNYHKNVEPERREELGFTSKEIEDARRDGYTLVGTYELFKAIRLYQENIISKESIRKNLETRGLFVAIPNTFENIGKIENILDKKNVICLTLANNEVNINDELLIIDDNNYFKTRIKGLMNNDEKVDKAAKNMQVGIQVDRLPSKKSSSIYLIKS